MTSPLDPNLAPNYPQGPRSVIYLEANRDPTVLDTKYRTGQYYFPNTEWRNTSVNPNKIWKLANITSKTNANWFLLSGSITGVQTLSDTAGTITSPDVSGNIQLSGSSNIGILADVPNNKLVASLTGVVPIANGGTNASSFTPTNGIVKYDGTRLVSSTTAKIDASNRITNTSQPLVFAYVSTNVTNATGDGTTIAPIIFNGIVSQQGTSYNATTGVFTAPVTGYYWVSTQVTYLGLGAGHTLCNQFIQTSAFANYITTFNPGAMRDSNNNIGYPTSKILGLTGGDSFNVQTLVSGSTKTVGVSGGAGPFFTWLNVFLIC